MSDISFKALRVEETANGEFDKAVITRSIQDLPEGELTIRVQYSSLNFKDALSAHGNRGVTRKFPHTPGIDAAGEVVEDTTGRFSAGDKVIVTGYDLGMNTDGGLAQYIRIPAAWAVPLPTGLTLRESMILGTAGLTAALCVDKLLQAGAKPEDGDVLVTGSTGGVGSVAIALLSKLGFSVTAATGKLEASKHLTDLGAGCVIGRDSLTEFGSKPMVKPQWAHAVDTLGGEYLFNVVKALHYGGSVAACGLAGGADFKGNVFPFILRNVNLLGVDSVELPLPIKAGVWQKLSAEMKLDNLGAMAEELTLEQVPQYLERIFNGNALGRYVVKLG